VRLADPLGCQFVKLLELSNAVQISQGQRLEALLEFRICMFVDITADGDVSGQLIEQAVKAFGCLIRLKQLHLKEVRQDAQLSCDLPRKQGLLIFLLLVQLGEANQTRLMNW
jgi:hypothetical protein